MSLKDVQEEGKKFRDAAGKAFSPEKIGEFKKDWEREVKKEKGRMVVISLVTGKRIGTRR